MRERPFSAFFTDTSELTDEEIGVS